jgi:hypothetical protein
MFNRLPLSAFATFAVLATTAFSPTSASAQRGFFFGGHLGGGPFGGGHFGGGHGTGWGHHWGGGGWGQSVSRNNHYPRPGSGGATGSQGTSSPGGGPAGQDMSSSASAQASDGMSSPAYAAASSAASYCATPRGNCHLAPQTGGDECRCVTRSGQYVHGIVRYAR